MTLVHKSSNWMRKTAYLGLFTALAMILGYVESMIPIFVSAPGMKLGLANLAALVVLYLYSWKEAMLVSCIRIIGVGILFGNLFSILFSLAGGILSMFCMIGCKKYLGLSCKGVSMMGGVAHNAGQILVAVFLVNNVRVSYYFPILAISGIVSGFFIGLLGCYMVERLQEIMKSVEK